MSSSKRQSTEQGASSGNGALLINGWLVEPSLDRVSRGSESHAVEPKTMAVLIELARRPGEVVSSDELIQRVWRGRPMGDNPVHRCISRLRHVLGDDARHPRYIATVPRKGYRLLHEPVPTRKAPGAAAADPDPPQNRRLVRLFLVSATMLIAALAVYQVQKTYTDTIDAGPPVDAVSIAVLPFEDLSTDDDYGALATAVTRSLIDRLVPIDSLLVIGDQTTQVMAGDMMNLDFFRNELAVRYLLHGTVLRANFGTPEPDDDRVTVAARLIDTRSGAVIWTNDYSRWFLADVQRVSDEIALAIAGAMQLKLDDGELRSNPYGTTDVAAYEAAIAIYDIDNWMSPEGWSERVRLLEYATRRDPQYASAWCDLAVAYWRGRLSVGQDYEWQEPALGALARAEALAPEWPRVHLLKARMSKDTGDWHSTQRGLQRAAELGGDTDLRYLRAQIDISINSGNARHALPLVQLWVQRDPLVGYLYIYLGHTYAVLGRLDEAFDAYETGRNKPKNGEMVVHDALVLALSTSDTALQRKWLAPALEMDRGGSNGRLMEAMAQHFGDREAALRWLHDAFEDGSGHRYWITVWAAHYGDVDLALAALAENPDTWIMWMPILREARTRPEFRAIVKAVGLVEFWQEFGWPEACEPVGDGEFHCF